MLVSDPLQYSEGQLWPVVPMAGQRFFGRRCEIVFAGLPALCPVCLRGSRNLGKTQPKGGPDPVLVG